MADKTSIIEFPCDFPIKIMMESDQPLIERVLYTIDQHIPPIRQIERNTRLSNNAKYTSITVLFIAENKAELDALYLAITALEGVKFVL